MTHPSKMACACGKVCPAQIDVVRTRRIPLPFNESLQASEHKIVEDTVCRLCGHEAVRQTLVMESRESYRGRRHA